MASPYRLDDENGVPSFGNVGGATNTGVRPAAAPQNNPRGIRSATFKSADGGTEPKLVTEMRAKNRERRLLQGLPQRTSPYARRLAIRNAGVGGDLQHSRAGWSTDYSANEAAQNALRAGYAGEDAAYTKAYGDITGRQDTAAESALDRANQLAVQGASNQGALERQDQANVGAYAQEGLRQRGLGERQGVRSAITRRGQDLQFAPGGTESRRLSMLEDEAELRLDTAQRQADAEQAELTRKSLGKKVASLADYDANTIADFEGNIPQRILDMEPGEEQTAQARDFLARQVAEQAGAVMRPTVRPFDDEQLGVGALRDAKKMRTGNWLDSAIAAVPGLSSLWAPRRGDIVYRGAGGETLLSKAGKTPRGIQAYNRARPNWTPPDELVE